MFGITQMVLSIRFDYAFAFSLMKKCAHMLLDNLKR
jgi:hypothetical protein